MIEQVKVEILLKLENEIVIRQKQIEKAQNSIEPGLLSVPKEIITLKKELNSLLSEKENIKNAKTLDELFLDFKDAIQILKSNNSEIILDEEDIINYQNINSDKPLKDINDLVLIHKTMYLPENDKIYTTMEKNIVLDYDELEFEVNGKKLRTPIKSSRNTLHFCVNSEVSGDFIGANDWKNFKYAVIVPFSSVPKEKIANAYSVDTYTYGGIELDDSCYILCPHEEYEKVKSMNPNTNVIKYKGNIVQDYATTLIGMLGYKKEIASNLYWTNKDDNYKFMDIVKNYPQKANHAETDDAVREDVLEAIHILASRFKQIEENISIESLHDIYTVFKQIQKWVEIYSIKILGRDHKLSFEEKIETMRNHFQKEDIALDIEMYNLISEKNTNVINDIKNNLWNKLKNVIDFQYDENFENENEAAKNLNEENLELTDYYTLLTLVEISKRQKMKKTINYSSATEQIEFLKKEKEKLLEQDNNEISQLRTL